jgi:hypothetical protein
VITLGTLDLLEPHQYWTLRDGSATVLILPAQGMGADLDPLVGYRVEVRGIMRRIRPKEYLNGVDADLVEDPSLPVLPEPRFGWPRNSITVLSFAERGERGDGSGKAAGALVRDVLEEPARYAGKTVRLRGQFRGRNLFGDLPAASQRDRAD